MKIKILFIYILLSFCSVILYGQNAKYYYESAKESFENGKLDEGISFLNKCEQLLGGSNPKIECLKCQILVQKSDWVNAGIAFKNYERLLPESYQNGEAYRAMLELKKTIWIELENIEKKRKEDLEKEINEDLEVAEQDENDQDSRNQKKMQRINKANEEQIYKAAMLSKDSDLLQFYREEIGTSSENGKKIEHEIDKQTHPNSYIVQAVEAGDIKEVDYLVSLGADKNKKNMAGENLLHVSIRKKDFYMMEHLAKIGTDKEAKNSLDESPLLLAIKLNFKSGAIYLLENNADPKATNNKNKSALFYCLLYNEPEVVKYLVKYGIDVNISVDVERVSVTPIYYAVYHSKSYTMASTLISLGFKVNDYSNGNWTPLMAAVYLDNQDMVKLILSQAEVNQKGPHGWTALHFAVRQRNTEVVKLLLEKGADKSIQDVWKRTPRKVGREYDFDDVLKVLKSY